MKTIAGPGGAIGPLPRPNQRWANHRKKTAKRPKVLLEMPKNAFQKPHVITFTCFFFFGHCTVKNKDIALKFCMRVLCMYLKRFF